MPQIRASIYTLSFGGPLLSHFIHRLANPEDYKDFDNAIQSSLSVQGLALLCTAVYETFKHQLTLFHAVCVIHLLFLLGVNVVSRGRYRMFGALRQLALFTVTIIALGTFSAFSTFVWITAPQFGSQPECNNQTIYVIFGVSINVTSSVFRWIMAAIFLAAPGIILLSLLIILCCLGRKGLLLRIRGNDRANEQVDGEKFPAIELAIHIAFCIYAIVSLEQTINRNNVQSDEEQWTFGQIIALFILIGTANELLNLFLSTLDNRGMPNETIC